jgi:hypothetical protein
VIQMILASALQRDPSGSRRVLGFGSVLLAFLLVAGCEPTGPPPGAGTAPPSAGGSAGPASGTSTVTVNGATVQIVGAGNGTTDEFELAAGNAEMTVSTCPSNQVIPFVTLFDGSDTRLGLIVDAVYQMRNLAGGQYYLAVAANPDCVWTIAITPK